MSGSTQSIEFTHTHVVAKVKPQMRHIQSFAERHPQSPSVLPFVNFGFTKEVFAWS